MTLRLVGLLLIYFQWRIDRRQSQWLPRWRRYVPVLLVAGWQLLAFVDVEGSKDDALWLVSMTMCIWNTRTAKRNERDDIDPDDEDEDEDEAVVPEQSLTFVQDRAFKREVVQAT